MSYLARVLTATVDMTGFNAGMRGLIQKCRIAAPVVVKKEAGELIKELVLRSPPKDPKKSRAAIGTELEYKFRSISDNANSNMEGLRGGLGNGAGGIRWLTVDSRFLFGVAPQKDFRKASVADLAKLRFQITKSGRSLILPFRHPRKRQRVLLVQAILTKKSTVAKLIARVRKNVGRLKAGWLVGVTEGKVSISGAKMPPAWVTVHVSGARGRCDDFTGMPNKPAMVLANSAKGITQKGMNFIVQLAVKSRAASMVGNARAMFSGKKRLATYGLTGAAYNAAK